MGLGYVVTGILYRGLCPDALNDPIHLGTVHSGHHQSVVQLVLKQDGQKVSFC